MSHKETVTVKFIVQVGGTKSGCLMRNLEIPIEAPAALCTPRSSMKPDPDKDVTKFVLTVIREHTPYILLGDPWRCAVCDKPARDLCQRVAANLSCATDHLPSRSQEPSIECQAIPVCFGGGSCARVVQEFIATSENNAHARNARMGCENCAKTSGIKLCGACKQTGYCSLACQKKRWPVHKDRCKLAQKEQKEQMLKEQKLKGQEVNGNPPEEDNKKAKESKPTKEIDAIVWQGKGNKKVPREATAAEQEEIELAIKADEKRKPMKKDQTFQIHWAPTKYSTLTECIVVARKL